MNTKRWSTRRRIISNRKRRQINFDRYNKQMPLPFPDLIQAERFDFRGRFDEYD